MYVRSLSIQGLSDLSLFSVDSLGRMVRVKGPSLAATAVGDGLALAFAALSEDVLRRLLCRWGLVRTPEDAEIEGDDLPSQAIWKDRRIAKTLVADHTQRRISTRIEILLDPLLCADLRAQAGREPRLSLSLGAEHTLTLEVSAFFGASWDVMSISIQSLIIGSERFATSSSERAPWLTRLLKTLGERYTSHDESTGHAQTALSAMVSPESEAYDRYLLWSAFLAAKHGQVRVAQNDDGRPLFMLGERPLARHGPAALAEAERAVTATLSGADIMWLSDSDGDCDALIEGDASPLEQVWSVSNSGEIDPEAKSSPSSVLQFGAVEE